ncbi:MAG: TRAP transporter small permease [Fusobacteriaceae bacterium]|jgi:TRAP-type C4-dicarboxylate transport system permease small subunit|nr:TRAP transporter small permease [Fusobacteriaceae bacterium]
MDTLQKIKEKLYRFIEVLSVVFLIGMVVVVCYAVFGRFVIRKAPRWGEEVALLCMVWFSVLSATLAIFDNRHIRVTVWETYLSPKTYQILEVIVHIILFGIIVLMLYYGTALLKFVSPAKMSGTRISYFWLYSSVPVASVFMVIATIVRIGEIIGRKS